MHRRHQRLNLPTEIARTVVAIADIGSFTKAADKLSLSQAAISAQVRRFESTIGAPAFERTSGGVKLTDRGAIAVASARKMLAANDQIVRLGGATEDGAPIRIGLSISYAQNFVANWRGAKLEPPAVIRLDQAANIQKAFNDRLIDVACVIGAFEGAGEPLDRWEEPFVWARGRNFLLSPGAPIPLVDWPHSLSNETAVRALERAGLAYRFPLTSADFHATTIAVAAGVGLAAVPERLLAAPLMSATEYYLPKLPSMVAGIYAREGFDTVGYSDAIERLRALRSPALPAGANSAASQPRAGAGRDVLMPPSKPLTR